MAEKLQQQPEEDPSPPVPHSDGAGAGATTSGEETTAKKEEEEVFPEPKRRKKCPTALEEFRPHSDSNQSFSFTFDTKSAGPNSQFTPKFGSFNLEKHLIVEDGCSEISGGAVEDGIGIDRVG